MIIYAAALAERCYAREAPCIKKQKKKACQPAPRGDSSVHGAGFVPALRFA